MTRKLFALAGLAVALAGVGIFAAIGVYVWPLRAGANRQADALAEKAGQAGDAADRAIVFVREVIAKADGELALARLHTPAEATRPPPNPLLVMTARSAAQDLAGSVARAHGAVVTASDAVVVADAALQVFEGSPTLKQLFGVNPEQVAQTQSALNGVATELRQARSVLGVPVPSSGEHPTPEQLNAVDQALDQAKHFTQEMAKVVTTARARVGDARKQVTVWAWRAALGTTAVAVLGAVGQLFMARFCWRKLRDLPA